MKALVRRISLGVAVVALAVMILPSVAYAGCGKSCYDIECVSDEPSIGCVERWGFCWEVPCYAAASSEGCPVNEALDVAFASFGDVTGEQALEKLRSDETFVAEILPFIRVVGKDGEVFRGDEYRRPLTTMLAEAPDQEEAAAKSADD